VKQHTGRGRRTKTNRHATVEALHEANAADLLSYFGRRITIAADAADLLSETFVVAWRRIDDLPADPQQARMWLFGVARRVLANFHRGAARRHDATERLHAHLAALPSSHVDADTLDVRAAIAALPDDQAELIRLVLWDGFTLGEAARILGSTEATARGRYQRARLRLREMLTAADDTDGANAPAGTGPRR
jgi:RNA polymerase sigma-70 factor (ECF subfamily)